jgi:hypothetical protein
VNREEQWGVENRDTKRVEHTQKQAAEEFIMTTNDKNEKQAFRETAI